MAKEWTVTPSEGVINNNDGTFSFSGNNTFCDKTYIIEYKDTGDGCACNAVFTQVGKECKTTSGDTIWDDYDCSLYPGRSITVNGHFWVYPRHVEECSTCVDDPSYSASTSMTVSCPVPCDDPWASGIGYSWCTASKNPGSCATVGCGSGDISGLEINSVSADKSWIGGFSWRVLPGETVYTVSGSCESMECDGGERCAILTINTNKGSVTAKTCQHGCKPECTYCNQCD